MVFDYVDHVREHVQISVGNPGIGKGPDLFSSGWELVLFFRHQLPFPIMTKPLLIQSGPKDIPMFLCVIIISFYLI